MLAFLLLFSGVASAFCSIDETRLTFRAEVASTASAPQSQQGDADDACPGLEDPAKQDAKPSAQWDGALGTPIISGHAVFSKPLPVIAIARRPPVAEPVFQHFPRLLI